MSGDHVQINRVESETDDYGTRWTISVRRYPDRFREMGPQPRASDVPEDVRDGIRTWLGQAEERTGG